MEELTLEQAADHFRNLVDVLYTHGEAHVSPAVCDTLRKSFDLIANKLAAGTSQPEPATIEPTE